VDLHLEFLQRGAVKEKTFGLVWQEQCKKKITDNMVSDVSYELFPSSSEK
jgi:hypothetical protein